MIENTSRLSAALADRYKIEGRLGEGGMATVYLAEDLKHKRKVVKVLSKTGVKCFPGKPPGSPSLAQRKHPWHVQL